MSSVATNLQSAFTLYCIVYDLDNIYDTIAIAREYWPADTLEFITQSAELYLPGTQLFILNTQ